MTYQAEAGIAGFRRGGRALTTLLQQDAPQLAAWVRERMCPAPHRVAGNAVTASLPLANVAALVATCEPHLPESLRASVVARRIAYIAGRLCAEHALGGHGLTGPLPMLASGEPDWSGSITGSITHTDACAYAVVLPRTGRLGIGIDSEPIAGADNLRAIADICCNRAERAMLSRAADQRLAATLIFSAKEAWYKAIHSTVRRVVDFTEVEVVDIDFRQQTLAMLPVPQSGLVGTIPVCMAIFEREEEVVHTSVEFGAALARGTP